MNSLLDVGTSQLLADALAPKFAVSYLRVSTRGQAERGGGNDEGFSIPAQREANKKKAASIGAIVGKEFVDRGASAKSADRPELQKMLEYVRENADRVDYVIVHKVDRLARNRGDDVDIMRVLNECGVQLVSTSESIDDTPSGMLLHGIMSSIAEFYSQNLANEVKKGLSEKVKSGGTPNRSPLGYLNVRRIDDKGREYRTVIVDEERGPLITLAFKEYAKGTWTLEPLAEYLAKQGLCTRSTPKLPSTPMNSSLLQKILVNPYYRGKILYNGVEYDGAHTPLIDEKTWFDVQDVLKNHQNGERDRVHTHYLKGSIFCKNCGSRMIISYSRNSRGIIYPYFGCSGRHGKYNDCKMKHILIDEVERGIERIYDSYTLKPETRKQLQEYLSMYIGEERKKYDAELTNLVKRKEEIERRQKKLLEAHYNDAIPLNLLRQEQSALEKELNVIKNEIEQFKYTFDDVMKQLNYAFDIMENCGKVYRNAPDGIKKMMNKALFEKFYVSDSGLITEEPKEPYKTIHYGAKLIENETACADTDDGVDAGDFLHKKSPIRDIFLDKCSNKAILVDDTRLELVTSRTSSGCATSCANRPSACVILHLRASVVKAYLTILIVNYHTKYQMLPWHSLIELLCTGE